MYQKRRRRAAGAARGRPDAAAGEIVALAAPSGAGKSTLLHLAGLLEKPDGGSVMVKGRDAGALADAERTAIRRDTIGFVYQFHHLLGEFSALENVVLPQMIAGQVAARRCGAGKRTAARLRTGARADHLPGKLSGGEQQRVAIARALANAPAVLLADEPTGNLDVETAGVVFEELLATVRRQGVAALIATHNPDLAARMDRTVTLREGKSGGGVRHDVDVNATPIRRSKISRCRTPISSIFGFIPPIRSARGDQGRQDPGSGARSGHAGGGNHRYRQPVRCPGIQPGLRSQRRAAHHRLPGRR